MAPLRSGYAERALVSISEQASQRGDFIDRVATRLSEVRQVQSSGRRREHSPKHQEYSLRELLAVLFSFPDCFRFD
jgi:hypothetical protein